MPAQTKVPNKTQMRRYLSRGLTQQQIVDTWHEDSGEKVSRSAIAMAIERYDLSSAHKRPSYPDMLPWIVATQHLQHIDARMLRLEGRRRAKGRLSTSEQRWLDQWKNELRRQGAVVHYERNSDEGFFWVPAGDPGVVVDEDRLIDRSNAVKGGGATPQQHQPAAQRRD